MADTLLEAILISMHGWVDKTKICPGCALTPMIGRHYLHGSDNKKEVSEEEKNEKPKRGYTKRAKK